MLILSLKASLRDKTFSYGLHEVNRRICVCALQSTWRSSTSWIWGHSFVICHSIHQRRPRTESEVCWENVQNNLETNPSHLGWIWERRKGRAWQILIWNQWRSNQAMSIARHEMNETTEDDSLG